MIAMCGPIAKVISWPMVVAQNSIPLVRPWDTLYGLVVVSFTETLALVLLSVIQNRYVAARGLESTGKPNSPYKP